MAPFSRLAATCSPRSSSPKASVRRTKLCHLANLRRPPVFLNAVRSAARHIGDSKLISAFLLPSPRLLLFANFLALPLQRAQFYSKQRFAVTSGNPA